MKNVFSGIILSALITIVGCGQKSHDHEHNEMEEGGNQGLYEEVMKVHDEVMPRMNDIYKLKEELKKQINGASEISEEKKKKIESIIVQLDSANESMMIWMRNFNPLPDSLGEEKAREYLENEKEKVNKVKEDMLKAIDEAKALT